MGGIEIAPLEVHKMINSSAEDIKFIVVSESNSHGDKVPVD